ncbi:MAG: DUF1080 domain-containing protein [bacterium]|nr:DUF1080 domain-containing protein [bacterium]
MRIKWFQDLFAEDLSFILSWLLKIIASLAGLVALFTFLGFGWDKIAGFALLSWSQFSTYLGLAQAPRLLWLCILVLIVALSRIWRKLNIVAGSFKDDFSHGLVNWEYGGESWTTQRGEKGYELNITNSGGGGITNFGFSWDNYEFSFECKLLNRNVGWIVRAADRDNYIMIQLSNTHDKITINPHYHVRSGWFSISQTLNASEKLLNSIKAQDWLKVRIIVLGNNIDVFINKERVLNYHIPDPARFVSERQQAKWKPDNDGQSTEDEAKNELVSISYPSGRVGFRCHSSEQALIRSVKVRPLMWSSKYLS